MNTSKFKYPIFVKNTSDFLVQKLEQLGYTTDTKKSEYTDCIMTSAITQTYLYMNSECFYDYNPHSTWNCAGRVNCENNIKLALALAAVNDENDYMQWFTNGTDWKLNMSQKWDNNTDIYSYENNIELYWEFDSNTYHKATKEEIINHFK